MSIPKIVIAGGGIYGWITALYFEKYFFKMAKQIDITVIESNNLPEIEELDKATSYLLINTLYYLGIDEFEFYKETQATFRYGTRHNNWKTMGEYYYGPIDHHHELKDLEEMNQNQYWLYLECLAAKKPLSEIHLYSHLMDQKLAPWIKNDNSFELLSRSTYSNHIDHKNFAAYLRKIRNKERIKIFEGNVTGAELKANSGWIESVILEDGTRIKGDLFIDCTGENRILLSGKLGSRWQDRTDFLPVNRAITFRQNIEEYEDILPYTIAEAMNCGWMLTMPSLEKKNCGYVYSDSFIEPDDARLEVEKYLGKPIEPCNDINFSSGFLDQACIGNSLALGPSQSFFEPLEAATMQLFILQLHYFTKKSLLKILKGESGDWFYNMDVCDLCEDMVDFVNLHYRGGRKDTPFWEYVTNECQTEYVGDLLGISSKRIPTPADIEHVCPTKCLDGVNILPVLDGLSKLNPSHARRVLSLRPKQRKFTRNLYNNYFGNFKLICEMGQGHRAFLEELNQ